MNSLNIEKIAFHYRDLLATPLRSLVPLTAQRQLVADIEKSGKYQESFPVLERLEDFDFYWARLVAKVQNASPAIKKMPLQQQADFISAWHLLEAGIAQIDFTGFPLVSRSTMKLWPIDFKQVPVTLDEYDHHVLTYLDRILTPSQLNLWQDLLDQSEKMLDQYVSSSKTDLENLRDLTKQESPEVIKLSAKMVGLNLRDDLLTALGSDRLRALIPMVSQFYKLAHTDEFIKLIELVLCSNVLLNHLYSNNYITFKSYHNISVSELLGKKSSNTAWFKTTHVNLYIEYEHVQQLVMQVESSSFIDLILSVLPIHLVLHQLGFYYEFKEQPFIYFASDLSAIQGRLSLRSKEIQSIPSPDAVKLALIFDQEDQVQSYLAGFTPPTPLEVFNSWGRFAGNLWFANNASGEAASWVYDEASATIKSTINSTLFLGFVSLEKLDYFTLEATCQSTNADDDAIGLVICHTRDQNKNKSIIAYRTNYTLSNWLLVYLEDNSTTILVNNSSGLTKGFQNPAKNGWKESGPTRIKVERNKNLVSAWTSSFGSTSVLEDTRIDFDLSGSERTKVFLNQCSYGYVTFSQAGTFFTDTKLTGGRTETIYDLVNDTKYDYNFVTKSWICTDSYRFVDFIRKPSRYLNPYTNIEFSFDQYGRFVTL